MNKEELRKKLHALPSPWDSRDIPYAAIPKKEGIPDEFSLRNKQTSVRNQGEFPTCTAFAACAIAEVLHEVNDLSECHLYRRRVNKPDLGMYPRDALNLLKNEGVCLESCCLYILDKTKKQCTDKLCKDYKEQSQKFRIQSYHRVFNKLKEALFQFKVPILIVVPIYENWATIGYDGVTSMPGDSKFMGYHALVLVGYTKKYLECKNSWGRQGDHGYYYIPQRYPVTEGWVMGDEEKDKKVEILNWEVGKKNLFGVNIVFTIHSTIHSQVSLFINNKKCRFAKHIRKGNNYVRFNIPFELNTTNHIRLEFDTGSLLKRNHPFFVWGGILKTRAEIESIV